MRRLRTGDGVYFTKPGARKLAHYVEREIERHLVNRSVPVALPIPVDPGLKGPGGAPTAKPSGPPQRPSAGPVLPLNAPPAAGEELLGGGRAPQARPSPIDPVAARAITSGEPTSGPVGRADDFSWPRGTVAEEPAAVTPAAMTAGQDPVAGGRQRGAAEDRCAAEGRRRGPAAGAAGARLPRRPSSTIRRNFSAASAAGDREAVIPATKPALIAGGIAAHVAASRPIADLTWASAHFSMIPTVGQRRRWRPLCNAAADQSIRRKAGDPGGIAVEDGAGAQADTFPKLLIRNAPPLRTGRLIGTRISASGRCGPGRRCSTEVRAYAVGLCRLGLKRGETIAIVGANRPRLYWSVMAAQMLGAVPVPVYADAVADELAYVLAHSDVRFAAVEDQEQVDKILSVVGAAAEARAAPLRRAAGLARL